LNTIKLELNASVHESGGPEHAEELSPKAALYKEGFNGVMAEDLGTPQALALLWEATRDTELSDLERRHLIYHFDKVLGLNLDSDAFAITTIPAEVETLLLEREAARLVKNWAKSDEIREKIRTLGYEVKDTENGQELSRI